VIAERAIRNVCRLYGVKGIDALPAAIRAATWRCSVRISESSPRLGRGHFGKSACAPSPRRRGSGSASRGRAWLPLASGLPFQFLTEAVALKVLIPDDQDAEAGGPNPPMVGQARARVHRIAQGRSRSIAFAMEPTADSPAAPSNSGWNCCREADIFSKAVAGR
jgi:hypothetical protein